MLDELEVLDSVMSDKIDIYAKNIRKDIRRNDRASTDGFRNRRGYPSQSGFVKTIV